MDETAMIDLPMHELSALVQDGEISPVESVAAALARIEATNPSIGAFSHVCAQRALEEARIQEKGLLAGVQPGPLAGVPFGVKDLEHVAGLPTSHGSAAFVGRVATEDSVQVARLRAAGAIVVGKTNTSEFGCTAYTKNLPFGVTRNPWNLERTPGGSSGGSGAAIAARMVPMATAADGGGSIRIPACYVGAFGMKPSFGRVPTGDSAMNMLRWADTLHYGPLTRSIRDAALMLDVTAGPHPSDPNSLPPPGVSYSDAIDEPLRKLRIAFSKDLGYARVDADVLREVHAGVEVFRSLGHAVDEIDTVFPDIGRAWAYLAGSETYAELAPAVEGREHLLGRGFWQGTLATAQLTMAAMGDIARERWELNRILEEVFDRYDLLLTPTLPTEAFGAAGPFPRVVGGEPVESPLAAVAFTYPFNMSGHPAATVRAGMTDGALPAGLQIVAQRHRDDLVLQAAAAYDAVRPMDCWPTL
ncbi:MAG TPA: amidase family protein [Candidatus Binatia bacterium]|jgi:Asp-tRNA(Asn)/Glu-tRNA(Gln) amidotransferase A subunit family amidase